MNSYLKIFVWILTRFSLFPVTCPRQKYELFYLKCFLLTTSVTSEFFLKLDQGKDISGFEISRLKTWNILSDNPLFWYWGQVRAAVHHGGVLKLLESFRRTGPKLYPVLEQGCLQYSCALNLLPATSMIFSDHSWFSIWYYYFS